MSIKEIASELDLKEGNVRVVLHNLIQKGKVIKMDKLFGLPLLGV